MSPVPQIQLSSLKREHVSAMLVIPGSKTAVLHVESIRSSIRSLNHANVLMDLKELTMLVPKNVIRVWFDKIMFVSASKG